MIGPSRGILAGILGVWCLWTFVAGCYKEEFTTNPADKLRFSLDTLRFDTVFTSVGSATRSFKIYNDADKAITIDNIRIKGSGTSVFRMNVDGFPAQQSELKKIEIRANDSIYAFLEVTINPNQSLQASPFVISDQIDFSTNGNNQTIHLEAWGQNANYIPNRSGRGGLALLSCGLGEVIWDDPKPYVIYGVLFIDSCTLRLPAGTRVYMHGGIVRSSGQTYNDGILYVLANGRLLVEGTLQKKVYFTSDRLEKELKDEFGSWSGIRFAPGSLANRIQYAEINGPIVGIYADSSSQVAVANTIIHHTAGAGILAVHARMTIENCLIHSNGTHSIQFAYGGDYRIDYCTLANYSNDEEALAMNNLFVVDPEKGPVYVYPLNASITNTIITGSGEDELDLLDATDPRKPEFFKAQFSNTYLPAKELLMPKEYPKFFEDCPSCIRGKVSDTIFLSIARNDFRLDTLAKVNNKGKWLDRTPNDLLNIRRNNPNPDLGCYELK
jgi:hypothetical protein